MNLYSIGKGSADDTIRYVTNCCLFSIVFLYEYYIVY